MVAIITSNITLIPSIGGLFPVLKPVQNRRGDRQNVIDVKPEVGPLCSTYRGVRRILVREGDEPAKGRAEP